MKTAIKLVLIDLVIAQIVAPVLIMIPCTIYLLVTTGNLDKAVLTQTIIIPAQLAGQIMMGIYLWKAGYISTKKETWSLVSAPYLLGSAVAILTSGFVVSSLMSLLDWIPNIMEQSFDILQSGWGGTAPRQTPEILVSKSYRCGLERTGADIGTAPAGGDAIFAPASEEKSAMQGWNTLVVRPSIGEDGELSEPEAPAGARFPLPALPARAELRDAEVHAMLGELDFGESAVMGDATAEERQAIANFDIRAFA